MRKTHRTISILFPTFVGILLAVIALQIQATALEYLYPENYYDAPILFEPLFDIEIFLPIYVVAYIAAVVFQRLVGIRVWNTYLQRQKIFNLTLWQLTIIASMLFGIGFGLIVWHSRMGMQYLLSKFLTGTIIAMIYWCSNFITLFLIDKKKGSSQ